MKIIMYHYIRPIKESKYPHIKGLELDGFSRQLDFFQKNFQIITAEEVIEAINKETKLKDNALWLTFDDGYKDHIDYVFPELKKRGIQGTFFPPVQPIVEKTYLDVNAIHYIIASAKSEKHLIQVLKKECLDSGISKIKFEEYWKTVDKTSRYDNEEITFFKRMLQKELPSEMRNTIVTNLLEEFVGVDKRKFCSLLYMTSDDIKNLIKEGMHVGSHAYSHLWLNTLSYQEQKKEITRSVDFLSTIGAPTKDWIMCYPYGSYNNDTLAILKDADCAIGLTIKVGEADLNTCNPFELPRFNTNDFPQ